VGLSQPAAESGRLFSLAAGIASLGKSKEFLNAEVAKEAQKTQKDFIQKCSATSA